MRHPSLKIEKASKAGLKKYFGYKPTDQDLLEAVKELFAYCHLHDVFWNHIVYSKCPMCDLKVESEKDGL